MTLPVKLDEAADVIGRLDRPSVERPQADVD
jgi:hypothetical protein